MKVEIKINPRVVAVKLALAGPVIFAAGYFGGPIMGTPQAWWIGGLLGYLVMEYVDHFRVNRRLRDNDPTG